MTKPAESKHSIPSPEDRVRAIREREQKATKGPWEYRSGDDNGFFQPDSELEIGIYAPHNAAFIAHARADIPYLLPLVEELIPFCDSPCGHTSQYAYSEDGGKNIVCLICEREELKGQVVSASPQPKCPRCTDSTLTIGQGDGRFWVTCGRGHAAEVPLDFQIADFAQFFVAAPAAEVRKRKDYHAEYVEAVEAAEKAKGDTIEECCKAVCLHCRDSSHSENYTAKAELINGKWIHREVGFKDSDGFDCYAWAIRSALTPEPASQAAKEKP